MNEVYRLCIGILVGLTVGALVQSLWLCLVVAFAVAVVLTVAEQWWLKRLSRTSLKKSKVTGQQEER